MNLQSAGDTVYTSVMSMVLVLLLFAVTACGTPKSFVHTSEPGRTEIDIKDSISMDQAWSRIVDIAVRRFDIEIMEKDTGYLRTGWLYTWTGERRQDYRVRLKIKMHRQDHTVSVISEAEIGGPGEWETGTDEDLLAKIKSDLMGTIGRQTR